MGIGLDSFLSDFDGNSEGLWELLLSRVARVTAWFSAGPFEFRCASEPQIEAKLGSYLHSRDLTNEKHGGNPMGYIVYISNLRFDSSNPYNQ